MYLYPYPFFTIIIVILDNFSFIGCAGFKWANTLYVFNNVLDLYFILFFAVQRIRFPSINFSAFLWQCCTLFYLLFQTHKTVQCSAFTLQWIVLLKQLFLIKIEQPTNKNVNSPQCITLLTHCFNNKYNLFVFI